MENKPPQSRWQTGGEQQPVLAGTDFPGKYETLLQNSSSRWGNTVVGRITCTTTIYIYIYKYIKHSTTTTTTTIISEGADPLRPAWCHPMEGRSLRASPEYVRLLPASGSPNPRFPPYVVRPLHVHGAPAYGDDTAPDGKIVICWRHMWETLAAQAVLIWTNPGEPGRHSRSGAPKRRSKRCGRTERRRAPNVTRSVVWRTCVPRSI